MAAIAISLKSLSAIMPIAPTLTRSLTYTVCQIIIFSIQANFLVHLSDYEDTGDICLGQKHKVQLFIVSMAKQK